MGFSAWREENYANSLDYELPEGDGTKTVARRRVAGVDDLLDWLEANLLEPTDSSLETPHVEP